MTEPQNTDSSERADRPGKTRTWWHPLLARLLDYELATAYAVRDEVLVGKLPLRQQFPANGKGIRRVGIVAASTTSGS